MSRNKNEDPLWNIRQRINAKDKDIIEALANRQHFFRQLNDREYAGPLQENIIAAMIDMELPGKFLTELNYILSETPLENQIVKDEPVVTGVSASDLDYQLLEHLLCRYKIVQEVTLIKQQHDIAPVVPERAREVVQRNVQNGSSKGLSKEFVENVYELILEMAHDYEESVLNRAKTIAPE